MPHQVSFNIFTDEKKKKKKKKVDVDKAAAEINAMGIKDVKAEVIIIKKKKFSKDEQARIRRARQQLKGLRSR